MLLTIVCVCVCVCTVSRISKRREETKGPKRKSSRVRKEGGVIWKKAKKERSLSTKGVWA